MRRPILLLAPILAVLVFTVSAQEKKIQRKDLPPAVERTVTEQSQGAEIRGFSTEVENGTRLFEMKLTVDGHSKDVSMDNQGRVVEVEEEVPLGSLPPAVKDGLITAAGPGTVGKVESLTKGGKLVAYEAVVTTGTKRREVQVGLDGKKLPHPE